MKSPQAALEMFWKWKMKKPTKLDLKQNLVATGISPAGATYVPGQGFE